MRGNVLAGAERLVDDLARLERLELRAHERAALARLDVLELDDAVDRAVDLDVHAVLELVGVDVSATALSATSISDLGKCGEHLVAVLGDDDEVLDADAEAPGR